MRASENRPATIWAFRGLGLLTWAGRWFLGLPADFGILIAAETEKWGKVAKFAGIKPE